jgi:hypothetical protein
MFSPLVFGLHHRHLRLVQDKDIFTQFILSRDEDYQLAEWRNLEGRKVRWITHSVDSLACSRILLLMQRLAVACLDILKCQHCNSEMVEVVVYVLPSISHTQLKLKSSTVVCSAATRSAGSASIRHGRRLVAPI